MKYGIWRHENAFGNSAEHTVGLAKHIARTGDEDPIVYVENQFQKEFAMCIPGITPDRIRFFDPVESMNVGTETWGGFDNESLSDIYMPNPYPDFPKSYPASWADLTAEPDVALEFPNEYYENKHNLPEDAIVFFIREYGTFWKRSDGATAEPHRFVDPMTFFNLAIHYAEQGYTVVRIGDKNQSPMPEHENIIDFAMVEDRSILDDLYVINKSKVYLSCDSGIWPMVGGMKKNLVLSNVAKTHYLKWLPEETTTILFKSGRDNSFAELKEAVDKYL